jgi:hypothetical protein
MGNVKSISMPRVITCAPDVPCAKTCYVRHFDWRRTVQNAYENNLNLWLTDPDSFEQQAIAAAYGSFYFRWHVSGDIISQDYLAMMCRVARKLPHTHFLAFTKQYKIVNQYLAAKKKIPKNLHILFSEWPGYNMDNTYNLPVAYVSFKNGVCDAPADANECGGHCEDCAYAGKNCWVLKKGQSVVLREH